MEQEAAVETGTPADAPIYARNSGWAIAALFCSAAVCCPVMSIIGPVLGLRALIQINADPHRIAGKGMARAAIVLGLAAAVIQVSFFWWWQSHARLPMLQGPRTEILAGQRGEWTAVRAGFSGDGATATDAQLQSFFSQLSRRYGMLMDSSQKKLDKADIPTVDPYAPRVFYTMKFDRQAVEADACFELFRPNELGFVLKWRWLRIIDPVNGDLLYPASANPPPATAPASTLPAAPQP